MNKIDKEAIEKVKWLKDYCIIIGNNCSRCIFDRENEKEVFNGEGCLLKRSAPDQWNI